ncbi:hypothetical protein AVEN_272321-1 [Araneus ventricosus]|uniref:Uncharacterized protein n=1 Tax=Araneus ventricosus TaxID=182803 RepID=A0A4Y2IYL0_ARAVE|nr:hypothetical protein AVEN_272321-1 [Araneus ventricosus]
MKFGKQRRLKVVEQNRFCTKRHLIHYSSLRNYKTVVHRAEPSYSDIYKSVSTSGQSEFLLSIKIRDSGPKGPRFKSTHCHSGNYRTKYTQHIPSVPLIDGSTKNHIISIFCYIHQMAARQLLQQPALPIQSL